MCGIIGIYKHEGNVNVEVYEGLLMLQHRGQDSAGSSREAACSVPAVYCVHCLSCRGCHGATLGVQVELSDPWMVEGLHALVLTCVSRHGHH